MDDDLRKKFDELCSIRDQPGFFITEHFFGLRNDVDIGAEVALNELQQLELEEEITRVNEVRTQFIGILKEREQDALNRSTKQRRLGTEVNYESLRQRVDEFAESVSKGDDICELEDAYLELALEIIDETNQLESRLLGNETFFYAPSMEKHRLGNLVHFGEAFLNGQEVEGLKSGFELSTTRKVYKALLRSLNASLVVPFIKPFVVTKSMVLICRLVEFLSSEKDLSATLISFENSQTKSVARVNERLLSVKISSKILNVLLRDSDGLDSVRNPLEFLESSPKELVFQDTKLNRRDWQLCPFSASLSCLSIRDTRLDSVDTNELATCVNLKELSLTSTYYGDFKFNLDFLALMKSLEHLSLKLPDQPQDFKLFEELKSLKNLDLQGPSSKRLFRLTSSNLNHVGAMLNLKSLWLTDFSFEDVSVSVSSASLTGNIRTDENQAAKLAKSVFGNLSRIERINLSNCQSINLSHDYFSGLKNLISLDLDGVLTCAELPDGIFAGLSQLKTLSFSSNKIQRIRRGAFDGLNDLTSLDFTNSLVESIEADIFLSCASLTELDLFQCRLTSINNRMFAGLKSLKKLGLNFNQIASIQVITNEQRVVDVSKAALTADELELIKEYLFRDLVNLESMKLASNKLKKMDLNCFWNLDKLQELDLSYNQIDEINRETDPSILPVLTRVNLNRNKLVNEAARTTFWDFPGVLVLSGHNLCGKDSDFFESCQDVISLALSERSQFTNNTTLTVQDSFASVESLYLSFCSIRSLHKNWFERMTHMTHLSVSNNRIVSIDESNLFADLPNLESIDLSKNSLKRINRRAFNGLWKLRNLDLSYNSLSSIDPGVFRGLESLKDLCLSSNNISYFSVRRLLKICNNHLESLGLDYNQLDNRSFDDIVQSDKIRLKYLYLGDNNLENMEFIQKLPSLNCLDLSNNKIESLESNGRNLLDNMIELDHLDLSKNCIKSVPDECFARLQHQLRYLNLTKNPLDFTIVSVLSKFI